MIPLFELESYKGIDFSAGDVTIGHYEECTFVNCSFAKVDLSDRKFIECEFVNCDFSLSVLNQTALREVYFKECKLIGLHFEDCHSFGFSMRCEGCLFTASSFHGMMLKTVKLADCQLHDVDFEGADLSEFVFDNCDLQGATFEHTTLKNADFRTATNYTFHPEHNGIKGAKFSLSGIRGLLKAYEIIIE